MNNAFYSESHDSTVGRGVGGRVAHEKLKKKLKETSFQLCGRQVKSETFII